MGQPANIERIIKDMGFTDDILFLQPKCLKFWSYLKIQPEKWEWREKSVFEPDGGFWVVGILGKYILYYNDIEEGYNFSPYTNYGEIDTIGCSQGELYQVVESIFKNLQD